MQRVSFLCLLALVLLMVGLPPAAPVRAASCAWTGAVSSDWATPGNWSCNAVPGIADSVIISNPGAPITLNTSTTLSSLTMLSGTLRLAGTLTVTQAFDWQGGGLSNTFGQTATLDLPSTTAITISSVSGGQSLFGVSLINNSTIRIDGIPSFTINSGDRRGQLINNGLLEFQSPGVVSLTNSGDIINNGTLRKAGPGALRFTTLTLINNGLLDIGSSTMVAGDYQQRGGEVRLNGGALSGGASQFAQVWMDGGTISGSGTITGTLLQNGGVLAPVGQITIIGGYTQSPTATLAVTISGLLPVSEFGTLEIKPNQGIGGSAAINGGQLRITTGNGFLLASSDRFRIVTCTIACHGAFGSVSGALAPAFGGFPGNKEIVVAETRDTLLVGVRPQAAIMQPGEENTYILTIRNPTTATVQVSNLQLTWPISFTYQNGSTSGATTVNPIDTPVPANGTRQLRWNAPFSIPGGATAELRVRMRSSAAIEVGTYTIDLDMQVGLKTIAERKIAPITLPLRAVQSLAVINSVGVVQPGSDGRTVLMLPRSALANGMQVRVRIVCPFTTCGNLTNVFLEHGGKLLPMSPAAPTAILQEANDYGFWDGFISGPNVFPGEPVRIFPDWDDHRPCIFYDYGGGGGRPQGCVPGGDDLPIPQLYDPSGVISDAATGQPIVGATVTLYRIPNAMPDTRTQSRDCRTVTTRGGNVWSGTAPNIGQIEDPTLRPIQIDPQINPQITGGDGRYGWNVVSGCWYVEVRAPGYQTRISALVGVPPEVTDLDVALQRDPDASGTPYLIYLGLIRK